MSDMGEMADVREEGLIATVEFDAVRLRALRLDDPAFNGELVRLGMVVWAAFNSPDCIEVRFTVKESERG